MSLFSSPKPPTPAEVPAPPTRDEAREALDRDDELRRRRGRASTVLSGLSTGVSRQSAGRVLTGVG